MNAVAFTLLDVKHGFSMLVSTKVLFQTDILIPLRIEWFEIKMKFDESDNVLIRVTRSVAETLFSKVGTSSFTAHHDAIIASSSLIHELCWE